MASAFNFNTDGTVDETDGAQTPDQVESTVNLYLDHYDDKVVNIGSPRHDLLSKPSRIDQGCRPPMVDAKLYNYLLKSYGLDASVESKVTIKHVLESDVSDPKSYANTLSDQRYRKLAAAVNFAADGTVTTARAAQGQDDELATVKLYSSRAPANATDLEKSRIKTESTYLSRCDEHRTIMSRICSPTSALLPTS